MTCAPFASELEHGLGLLHKPVGLYREPGPLCPPTHSGPHKEHPLSEGLMSKNTTPKVGITSICFRNVTNLECLPRPDMLTSFPYNRPTGCAGSSAHCPCPEDGVVVDTLGADSEKRVQEENCSLLATHPLSLIPGTVPHSLFSFSFSMHFPV